MRTFKNIGFALSMYLRSIKLHANMYSLKVHLYIKLCEVFRQCYILFTKRFQVYRKETGNEYKNKNP